MKKIACVLLLVPLMLLSCISHPENSIEDSQRGKELLTWVVEEGNTSAYSEISGDYFLANRSKEFLYYTLIMANKYHNAQAHYDVYCILTDFSDNNLEKMDHVTKKLALYHLDKSKELNVATSNAISLRATDKKKQ